VYFLRYFSKFGLLAHEGSEKQFLIRFFGRSSIETDSKKSSFFENQNQMNALQLKDFSRNDENPQKTAIFRKKFGESDHDWFF